MNHHHLTALILAAGKGTRMKSDMAKVLHEVYFAPMICHVVDVVQSMSFDDTIVITGHQCEKVEESLEKFGVSFARQEQQLGTAHAVLSAKSLLKKAMGTVVILCGDTPLIRAETLEQMLEAHFIASSMLTILTTRLYEPTNYGRIISDTNGNVLRIVEQKDATAIQKEIREINAGIYCVNTNFLMDCLAGVGTDNKQGEFYLTDIVEIANESGHAVNKFVCLDPDEVLGVNSRVELAQAHAALQARFNKALMLSGVTLMLPETVSIEKSVLVGRDTIVHANTHITGQSFIGERCLIEPGAVIKNCRLGTGVTVGAFSYLNGCQLADGEKMDPHTVRIGR
ncbi:MAG: bifunctional N-acetylglucosamine-1-phosphate uridyltransferase/glucosamine-1-phosphate acetyltransferase [Desulfobulbaceae bacterium]|nr:bifunctional N-acetylglucosamine-1-phosphate uridyltransferase/glucosamine-1-phosphate acetyltransferase [Desulfobulbaceae bacterium]MCK5543698.1 bifunctional N-acetylglucosamine-1-phosphate uridyltransferase/glucosamine-1-phosphate acetyltransferase [Desulfobulbaceae bacterium]